jgi:hypothetical protein
MRTTAVPIMLAMLSTPAWGEEQLPITIAPGNVIGEPEVSTRYFDGHKAWAIIWDRAAEENFLVIFFIEGLTMPDRERRKQMLDLAHDSSSDDEADLRQHIEGRIEPIWGLEVYWFGASERAVMNVDNTKPETFKDGKVHRGDAAQLRGVRGQSAGNLGHADRRLLPLPRHRRRGGRSDPPPMAGSAGPQSPVVTSAPSCAALRPRI